METRTTMRMLAALSLLLTAGCSGLEPPPMEPLTAAGLAQAEQRWQAHAAESYHLLVRVRPPRAEVAVYDVDVAGGKLIKLQRDGHSVRPEEVGHYDYSMAGLFAMLRQDLLLTQVPDEGNLPPLDLRAYFEPNTGRLVRYRRTVGSARRRVLMIEVLKYEPRGELTASRPGRALVEAAGRCL